VGVSDGRPYLAEAIRDGLRLEAIAADIAGDGDAALELLSVNTYDIAVLDRDVPGPSGDEIARHIVASGSGTPILMALTEPFRRGADRTRTHHAGVGLGLAITRAHDGTLTLTPRSAGKIRITVELPSTAPRR
jgi:DNA-binding response OmpR family regulator